MDTFVLIEKAIAEELAENLKDQVGVQFRCLGDPIHMDTPDRYTLFFVRWPDEAALLVWSKWLHRSAVMFAVYKA